MHRQGDDVTETHLMEPRVAPISLRDFGLPTRLVIAAFMVSAGIGYFSALVQLHFQHASPAKMLPDADDVANVYHGRAGMSHLERVLVAHAGQPFNGSGSMRASFTTRSAGWRAAINRRAKESNVPFAQAEEQLRRERDGERLALLDWIQAGAERKSFEENDYVLASDLSSLPITEEFVERTEDDEIRVKIGAIVETRCARCHAEGESGPAARVPLENWEQVNEYCDLQSSKGMSTAKLAQTTHVHLLGFAMLYCLTGLVVTFTGYPGWVRGTVGLVPLVGQVIDIGFWWLARVDPMFANVIMFTGGLVAVGLLLQIALSLFDLFGKFGKSALVVLFLVGALGGYVIKDRVIDPCLAREQMSASVGD